jgi:tuftelin-interacting protein 11
MESERPPFKRKGLFENRGPSKVAKTGNGTSSGGGKMTFAQKMMAKMGWEGAGLGKEGEGIVEPIQVQIRPHGVGLGSVKEMTKQAKDEAKRQAERRGEEYEDSSEEERKKRKRRQQAGPGRSGTASGASTPGVPRQKTRYKTVAELKAAAEGLVIPMSLIDATGKEQKLLTSAAGLLTPTNFTKAKSEEEKLADRAHLEVESFIGAWNKIQDKKTYIELERKRTEEQIESIEAKMEKEARIVDAVSELSLYSGKATSDAWAAVTSRLEYLQSAYGDDLEQLGLTEVAAAAIAPLFRDEMAHWNPLEDPTHLVSFLRRLRRILAVDHVEPLEEGYDEFDQVRRHRFTSPYETLIYTLWLPKVRTKITNEWDPHSPDTLLPLINAWKDILPDFAYAEVMEDLIVKKLSAAIKSWNPRKAHRSKYADDLPHIWLFPWFEHLDSHHLDPNAPDGLLTEVKRKFRVAFDGWDPSKGVMPGLTAWRDVLKSSLTDALIRHLLPRLSRYLSSDFQVCPPDQGPFLPVLDNVLAWRELIPLKAIARLLEQTFFPNWLNTLWSWLRQDDTNYSEIREWYRWWKAYFPDELNALLDSEWTKGLEMINMAIRFGDEKYKLPAPAAGPPLPIRDLGSGASTPRATAPETPKPVNKPQEQESSFKDIVEQFCDEESLLMVPMREAHPTTGKPLFRITASATGKGGVVVYLQGDILWARKKGDKNTYEPTELGRKLVQRAESR